MTLGLAEVTADDQRLENKIMGKSKKKVKAPVLAIDNSAAYMSQTIVISSALQCRSSGS